MTRRTLTAAAIVVVFLPFPELTGALGAQGSAVDGGRLYTLTPASRLEVRTGTSGLLAGLADRHVVRATAFSGSICYAPDDPSRSSVRVEVFADSLRVETPVDPEDRASIRESMLTEVLRADRFPTISFRSSAVRPTETGVEVGGELTLVG
nr:hypothetical protein [Gemmatimonadota bacterium]NIU78448.1 hypothetical protein [Gammaproteobacteria bacterium]NIQ58238.1 hypothetical protein [Gemmatimonadota bacterium]NIT89571.1 hypothetical protein [Gemmatimonadota bacterium]NIW66420.1 hypothetical protein [Gemmatimonadota bacterium]